VAMFSLSAITASTTVAPKCNSIVRRKEEQRHKDFY